MTLIIYIEDKTYCYSKEKNSDIKEITNIADVSAVIVKVFIHKAEDYTSVINISAEDTSVTFSSLSTLFNSNAFYFS